MNVDGLIIVELVVELVKMVMLVLLVYFGDVLFELGYVLLKVFVDFVCCWDLMCCWFGCDEFVINCDLDYMILYVVGGFIYVLNLKCYCCIYYLVKMFWGWCD